MLRHYVVAILSVAVGCAPADPQDPSPGFDVWEKSVTELAAALESGTATSKDLVAQYLARIEAYDQQGPMLNAVVTVNPDAMAVAASLDAERATGSVRRPLHGIPVVVKDNYDTGDMPTTAGAIALATSIPPDDAFQVRKLRDAGAIILAKTNMHELAYGLTTVSSFGVRHAIRTTRHATPAGPVGARGRRLRRVSPRSVWERHLRVNSDPVLTPVTGRPARDAWAVQPGRDHPAVEHTGYRRAAGAIG